MTAIDRLSAALADHYRLERELGAGGMATVYLAEDLKHDRKVALKVLKPELAAVLGAERFVQEIKTTAALQHPHILPLFDSGTADSFLYYVMPYIEGETLRDKLNRETQLGIDEAVRITCDIADALDYAHRRGVIHRDIKPENILLHDGRPMVADFGIALALSAAAGGRMTETGLSLGTPHYMSPEQATAEKELTNRSDIYSLGCVLYEMLTGNPPHVGSSAQQIIMKIVTDDARPVEELRRSVPPNVAAAVAKALERLPADRFASAAQFAGALTDVAFIQSTTARLGARGRAGWQERAAVPLAAAVVLLLFAAAWGWLRPRPAGPRSVMRLPVSLPDSAPLQSQFGTLFALSHDGSQIVYVGPGQGDIDLWSRPLNSLTATRIPGTNGGDSPFLSPDGQVVAFYRNTPNAVFTVSLRGGPRQTIATDSLVPLGGDFGPDGAIYFTRRGGIRRLPREGRVVEQVTSVDTAAGENAHAWVDVLPNGHGALFTIQRARIDQYDIAAVDFASHQVKILTRGLAARYDRAGHMLYATADGGLYAIAFDQSSLTTSGVVIPVLAGVARDLGVAHFAISPAGTLLYGRSLGGATGDRLEWVDRSGRSAVVDTTQVGSVGDLALSPDGRRLAVTKVDDDGRAVWIKELDHGPMGRLSLGGANSGNAAWTADGRSVTFVTQLGGRRDLYVRRADGSVPAESLFAAPRPINYAVETRDGQWIAYELAAGGAPSGRDLFARRLHGDTTPVALAAGPANEGTPRVSPDGHWLAYTSNESGRSEVYVSPFPYTSASRTQVSVAGGYEPLWSRNGRELFYSDEEGILFAAHVEAAPVFRVVARDRLFDRTAFTFFASGGSAYDVAPDGRRFIMSRPGTTSGMQLVLVLNWFTDLADAKK